MLFQAWNLFPFIFPFFYLRVRAVFIAISKPTGREALRTHSSLLCIPPPMKTPMHTAGIPKDRGILQSVELEINSGVLPVTDATISLQVSQRESTFEISISPMQGRSPMIFTDISIPYIIRAVFAKHYSLLSDRINRCSALYDTYIIACFAISYLWYICFINFINKP